MTLDRPLRSHSDFLKLWAAQTVSLFGSQVTMLALPLTAILTLHARPLEVGVLNAAGSAAALVASLPAGVWINRLRRRPALIAASLGQALVLASIPVAAWLGVLRLPQLIAVAFLAAAFAVFFNVAYRAYLPSLVPRSQLIEANSRLAASKNAAQIGGSGLAGALIQVFGAPVAILADSLSFVLSSLTLLAIRTPEPKPAATERAGIRREGVEGIRTLLGDPVLRSLAAASATFNLFDGVRFAVYVLFMSRELRLSAGIIGLIFGLAGAGGLAGTFAVAPLTGRLGLGRAIVCGVLLATAGELLIAGAHGPPLIATLILLAAGMALVYGWKLHLAAVVASVWIPLAATLTPAHRADNEEAPALIRALPKEVRYVLGDVHYNDLELRTLCADADQILITTRRGPYPHTDGGVEVRRLFHKLRSLAMENFNEHFKGNFGVHGSVPTKGLRNTQRFALGAILVYQLALLYRYEHGLDLNVGLKAFLQAA